MFSVTLIYLLLKGRSFQIYKTIKGKKCTSIIYYVILCMFTQILP